MTMGWKGKKQVKGKGIKKNSGKKHTAYESWASDGILQKEQECGKTRLLLGAFVIGNANIHVIGLKLQNSYISHCV